MSIFLSATATCTKCGTESEVDLAASVNADRRPELRGQILEGSFQAIECPQCGEMLRLPAHLTYIDVGRHQWILAHSIDELERWQTVETEARGIYEKNFGAGTAGFSREIGEGLTPRLVFGWPALREKLIAADLALDDATLEMLKIAVIRSVNGSPIANETEFRLIGGGAEKLSLSWLHSKTEESLSSLEVPRDAYDDILDEPEDWAPLRANFEGKLFVDLKRLLVGPD